MKEKKNDKRTMVLVCTKCRCLWSECGCTSQDNTDSWILVTQVELEHYKKTGNVPDYSAELCSYEGGPKVEPIPLQHPPQYGFKTT